VNRSQANYSLALFMALATSVLGLLVAPTIASSVFPELIFPRAITLAESGDQPPGQMLVAVTRPLEEAAYGVVGTSLVRSTTTRGAAEIDVTFDPASDPTTSFQLLNAALAETRSQLPAGTNFQTRLFTTGTFPIVDLSLSSRTRSLAELTDIALYDLVPNFRRIAGVYRAELVGGKYREYVVRLDPARMLARDLSPQQIVAGLAAANVVESPGRIADAHRALLVVVSSDLRTRDQLERIAVANVDGQPVHVSDIASVELGIREDYVRAASENGPSVLVGISRQPNGNTELIAGQARALITEFSRRYPDVTFSVSYDQSALVRESFQSVRDALALGLALSVAVVLGFTLSPISALIAALVVPACILGTFVVMKAAGMTFNMMTLGGLAAGIGLFIDDAIVMIEAIHRERASGEDDGEAIARSVRLLARPLIASTLTVIVVFVPLIFISGVTGTFFRALAVTLGAGLAISLALALFVTPGLELFLQRWHQPGRAPGRLFGLVRAAYIITVRPFIAAPWLSILLAVGGLALAAALFFRVGSDYLPQLDEGAFILDYNTPPQSTMSDTLGLLERIDAVLKNTPEVTRFSRRTGTQLGFFLTESNRGDFSVKLAHERRRNIEQVISSIRSRAESTVPGVRIEFSQVLQDLIGDLSGTPEPIEVKVFGSDQASIEAMARRVAGELRTIPGLVDVFDGVVLSNPEQHVLVDQTAAERYQLSTDYINAVLRAVVAGTIATSVRSGDRLIDVRVRYPEPFNRDLGTFSGVLLNSRDNRHVPLASVAKIEWGGEHAELARERLSPVVHVTARISGIDLGSAMRVVRERVARLALPPGVRLEYGGLYAQQQQAFGQLTIILLAGAASVFLVLLWEFRRPSVAVAVLAGAIPCLGGSFAALAITGITLNISSFMGLIMLVGIAAKNGILLLDYAERAVGEGATPAEAILDASRQRIRPILMTTIATVAGMTPLALGIGAGAKVQQPLAVVIIGGLIFSMLFLDMLAGGVYVLATRASR
jgi:CzcA family heavy metal efflux pump